MKLQIFNVLLKTSRNFIESKLTNELNFNKEGDKVIS